MGNIEANSGDENQHSEQKRQDELKDYWASSLLGRIYPVVLFQDPLHLGRDLRETFHDRKMVFSKWIASQYDPESQKQQMEDARDTIVNLTFADLEYVSSRRSIEYNRMAAVISDNSPARTLVNSEAIRWGQIAAITKQAHAVDKRIKGAEISLPSVAPESPNAHSLQEQNHLPDAKEITLQAEGILQEAQEVSEAELRRKIVKDDWARIFLTSNFSPASLKESQNRGVNLTERFSVWKDVIVANIEAASKKQGRGELAELVKSLDVGYLVDFSQRELDQLLNERKYVEEGSVEFSTLSYKADYWMLIADITRKAFEKKNPES